MEKYREYLKEGTVTVTGPAAVKKTVAELESQLTDWLKAAETIETQTHRFMVTKRLKTLLKADMKKLQERIAEVERVDSQYKGK